MTRAAAAGPLEPEPSPVLQPLAGPSASPARRILVLTPQFPYPPQQGTTIRNYNLIAGLARRHAVHLLSFGQPAACRGTPLDALCRTVQVIEPPERSTAQRLRGLLLSRLPDMAQRLPSARFQTALEATLDCEDFDVVEVEGIELAGYLLHASRRRGHARRPVLVFDDHNAEYVLQQRAFETELRRGLRHASLRAHGRRWLGAAYSYIQWQRLRRYERRACLAADRVVAVSEADAEALRRLVAGLRPVVVPNGVDMDYYTAPLRPFQGSRLPDEQGLVFTGKMDFRPNVDAVLWFAQEVLPLIRQHMPGVHFWAVGKDPHPRLAPLRDHPAVTLTGQVEDVRPYMARAAVYVVPLRIGGGTRLKVLEAMAMGKAIVSTTLGCEGFEVVAGREAVLADSPSDFAAATVGLLHDPARREALGHAARQFAASYDWRMIVPRLEQVYEG